jgi:hypothetical protein
MAPRHPHTQNNTVTGLFQTTGPGARQHVTRSYNNTTMQTGIITGTPGNGHISPQTQGIMPASVRGNRGGRLTAPHTQPHTRQRDVLEPGGLGEYMKSDTGKTRHTTKQHRATLHPHGHPVTQHRTAPHGNGSITRHKAPLQTGRIDARMPG